MFHKKPAMNIVLILALLFALTQTMDNAFSFQTESLVLVLTGTLITVLIRFGISGLADAFRATTALREEVESAVELSLRADSLAEKTHQNGITALEDHEDENAYFQEGLDLALTGLEPENVNQVLAEKMETELESTSRGCMVYRTIAESAPIFGFLGTLTGYVLVMQDLDNTELLHSGIAIMVTSTVYGVMLAYLLALPLADLLDEKCRNKGKTFAAILDGVAAIQRGSTTKSQPQNTPDPS